MFTSLNENSIGNEIIADICIVGGGPAGITLARSFLNSDTSVVLIESGNDSYDLPTQNLYKGKIENNLPPVPLDASRLRYFGGTSNHWTGHCGPFRKIDFEQRDWIENSGWPFDLDEMHQYYNEAHSEIELGLYNYSVADWLKSENQIFDWGGTSFNNAMLQQNPQRFGLRYRESIEKSNNVHCITDANLTQINYSVGNSVKSVQVESLSGSVAIVKAKKYVLCCGGVENARILLNSPAPQNLPALGRYFSFHPRLITGELTLNVPVGSKSSVYGWQQQGDIFTKVFVELLDEFQRNNKLPNNSFNFLNIYQPENPGYTALKKIRNAAQGMHPLSNLYKDMAGVAMNLDGIVNQWRNRHVDNPQYKYAIMTYMDQIPNPNSKVVLADNMDELGVRRTRVEWDYLKKDQEHVIRINEMLAKAVGEKGIGRIKMETNLGDTSVFKRLMQDSSGGGHQMGTTRIGSDIETSVVDSNLRVHGSENLYCAGSSVFPTYSWVNPTMTIVALSLRLNRHLRLKE